MVTTEWMPKLLRDNIINNYKLNKQIGENAFSMAPWEAEEV